MSLTILPPSTARLAALAAAGTAAAATALAGAPVGAAVAGCAALTVVAVPVAGPWAATALAPALGLLPGGGPLAIAAFGLAAHGLGWAASAILQERAQRRAAALQQTFKNAELESQILLGTIRRYPALLEACQELGTARELDQFAESLCRHARNLLPQAERIAVHLGSGGRLTCRAVSGGTTSESGEDERFVATEARPLVRRQGSRLRVLEPLRGDRRGGDGDQRPLRGVLEVTLSVTDIGERLALEQLEALARLGGLGLAAVDLVAQARSLALRDDLTGLYGQHEFLRRLEELTSAARRTGAHLGLVMCDMDHLKRLNDTQGHAAGDQALVAVARILEDATAAWPEAITCRYGGEEFAAALPGADDQQLAAWAEEVRSGIARVTDPAPVTASLGIALRRPDETARSALTRADAACYRAKAGGRNRVAESEDLGETDPDSGIIPRWNGVRP